MPLFSDHSQTLQFTRSRGFTRLQGWIQDFLLVDGQGRGLVKMYVK